MSPEEKIAHLDKCFANALDNLQHEYGPVYLADVLDVWDYWWPYASERLKKLEAVVRTVNLALRGDVGQEVVEKALAKLNQDD